MLEEIVVVSAVSLATPLVAGAIVALTSALEERTPAPFEERAVEER